VGASRKGNGSPPDEGREVKINVVDKRHHARAEDGVSAPRSGEPRYPAMVEELKARAEAAEKLAREAVVRAHRELDDVRERLERDVDRRVMDGKSRLLSSMVEVLDNLDRAWLVAQAESKAVADGIDLIRQQLLSLLKAEGVEPIETLGLEYDPNVAEAVIVEAVGPGRENLVLEELQRGYRYGMGVLRPARVKVGKTSRG